MLNLSITPSVTALCGVFNRLTCAHATLPGRSTLEVIRVQRVNFEHQAIINPVQVEANTV
jgi:hypothetical protein